jgi:hypothetical protein
LSAAGESSKSKQVQALRSDFHGGNSNKINAAILYSNGHNRPRVMHMQPTYMTDYELVLKGEKEQTQSELQKKRNSDKYSNPSAVMIMLVQK